MILNSSRGNAGDRGSRSSRAFSLVEMLVVIAMMGILLTGLSLVFSRSGMLARAQTEQAAMQQSLRVAQHEMTRYLRMAGSGGLPITWTTRVPDDLAAPNDPVTYDTLGSFPTNGFAVSVRNNTAEGITIPEGLSDGTEHIVIPGSDMLIVRGVFTTPVYYLSDPVSVQNWVGASGGNAIGGAGATVEIPNVVAGNYPQPLDPLREKLREAGDRGVPVAFLVRDLGNPDAYFAVEWANSSGTLLPLAACSSAPAPSAWPADSHPGNGQCITVRVKLDDSSGTVGTALGNLSMGNNLQADAGSIQVDLPSGANRAFLPIPKQVQSIGLLEEFRFYVRAAWEIPGDRTSRLMPVLTRAEYVPGSDQLIETVDIVQNILDLQIAVGIETSASVGAAGFASITDNGGTDDEVLFNNAGDVLLDPPQLAALDPARWFNPELDFHYLRLTTVGQASRPNYESWKPVLGVIEDVDRRTSFTVAGTQYNYNSDADADRVGQRNFQRAYLQTVVEMRNLK
ncbi:MAG: prepilin-type N-terminal cleavage/methylation domain-containing protein [Acidobacteriota bacterium]